MNARHEKLIELIGSRSINNPVTDADLLKGTGFSPAELEQVLDKMANQLPALIGRCQVQKAGQTIVQIWPSSAFKRANPGELNGGASIHIPPAAVRRETQRKEPEMAQDKVIRNVDIVKHVKDHPGSSRIDVINALSGPVKKEQNTTGVKIAQCLKQRYLAFDAHGSLILGDNEAWLAQHDLLEAKPAKVMVAKIETVYATGPAPKPDATFQPTNYEEGQTDNPSAAAPLAEQSPTDSARPTAEAQPAADEHTAVGQASLVGSPLADAADNNVDTPAIEDRAESMTVAYVSDGTLHLIGLQDKPIVLSAAQTGILKSFMTKCRLVG